MRPAPADNRQRSGVSPALLLDVQTSAGDCFYWSDRPVVGIAPVLTPSAISSSNIIESIEWSENTQTAAIILQVGVVFGNGSQVELSGLQTLTFLNGVAGSVSYIDQTGRIFDFAPNAPINQPSVNSTGDSGTVTALASGAFSGYAAWLVSTGKFTFNRSLVTDTASLTLQNLSGNVLQTEWEQVARRSTLEGAMFVFRYFDLAAEVALIEMHGTLTVGDARETAPLSLSQLLAGQDDTPEQQMSETCQLVWGEARCGATGAQECLYTYASCQSTSRFTGIQTTFEINNPATAANLPITPINRNRSW